MTVSLQHGQRVHLIGVGGTGMSAIARILLLQGYQVSGSDLRSNTETAQLQAMGATVYQGHDAAYVEGADIVITTSAAKPDHVEIAAARERGIPVYKRNDVIAAVMEGYQGVAVAGTHGKTTTTSMIVHILNQTGCDPSYIIGGVHGNTSKNADVGSGQYFVIEADEYDNMFHGLYPQAAVVTSLEYDHPDFFATPQAMIESFQTFVSHIAEDGFLILCADDAAVMSLSTETSAAILTYGIHHAESDYRAVKIRYAADAVTFDVLHQGELAGAVTLRIPGRHNILNALAALTIACDVAGLPFDDVALALSSFKGTGRRFDLRADVQGIAVIDDYAHHPTAIKTTINAARSLYPDREVWAIWQPHTYSRTQELWDAYLSAFAEAHHVLVTEIYAAREVYNPHVASRAFVEHLEHSSKTHLPDFETAVEILLSEVSSKSVILIMSAGDAPKIGIEYLKRLKSEEV